jgi:hypothetical protein
MLLRGLRALRADEGTGHDDDDDKEEWSTGQRDWFTAVEEAFGGNIVCWELAVAESEDQNQPMSVVAGCRITEVKIPVFPGPIGATSIFFRHQ